MVGVIIGMFLMTIANATDKENRHTEMISGFAIDTMLVTTLIRPRPSSKFQTSKPRGDDMMGHLEFQTQKISQMYEINATMLFACAGP
ncbi:hypothetical protein BJ165DRAFT_1501054 [Panaeolus papilionaceus]|nr:hypothetical protein BJ165DRAFT_1501054 [Panaeolus papilionaceus]